MEILELMRQRHSVRQYKAQAISSDIVEALQNEIALCNSQSGLNIQLATNEPKAFDGFMAHYGKFYGVQNYIALIGKRNRDLQPLAGYYGERLALRAQELGLNTCWVAMTYSKGKCGVKLEKGEKIECVIALGYGETQGVSHKVKSIEELCSVDGEMPDWFERGMKCAQLAPTAVNQQKFHFAYSDGKVHLKNKGGFFSKIDLGIVKYHFEIGAGKENFTWGAIEY